MKDKYEQALDKLSKTARWWYETGAIHGARHNSFASIKKTSPAHTAWLNYFARLGWRPFIIDDASYKEWTAPCENAADFLLPPWKSRRLCAAPPGSGVARRSAARTKRARQERAMKGPTITIDLDRKCAECGKPGAAQSGICLKCMGKAFESVWRKQHKPMKSVVGQEVAKRIAEGLRK